MDRQVEETAEKAAELGRLMAECPASKAYLKARRELQADEQARKLTEDYQQQIQKIAELEQDGKPVEPEDKRKLGDLQQQVASHPTLKAWMKSQVDFSELMHKVNEGISEPFKDEQTPENQKEASG